MGDKGWFEVQAELPAYLELALVILWEDICSRKFLISAKDTHLQSNTIGNVSYLSNIVCSPSSGKILAADQVLQVSVWWGTSVKVYK